MAERTFSRKTEIVGTNNEVGVVLNAGQTSSFERYFSSHLVEPVKLPPAGGSENMRTMIFVPANSIEALAAQDEVLTSTILELVTEDLSQVNFMMDQYLLNSMKNNLNVPETLEKINLMHENVEFTIRQLEGIEAIIKALPPELKAKNQDTIDTLEAKRESLFSQAQVLAKEIAAVLKQ